MDMELEPQLEDEIPSAADLLAGTFNISFATYEADLETSRKTTRPAEIDTLPFENNVIQDGVEQKEDSMRPKRVFETQRQTDSQQTSDRYIEAREVMASNCPNDFSAPRNSGLRRSSL